MEGSGVGSAGCSTVGETSISACFSLVVFQEFHREKIIKMLREKIIKMLQVCLTTRIWCV